MFEFVNTDSFNLFRMSTNALYIVLVIYYFFGVIFRKRLGLGLRTARILFALVVIDLAIQCLTLDLWGVVFAGINGFVMLFWIKQEHKYIERIKTFNKIFSEELQKLMKSLTEWAEKDFETAKFIDLIFKNPDRTLEFAETVHSKLERCTTIRGHLIDVLWVELCDKKIDRLEELCKNCPDEILEEACEAGDKSGKKILENYFKGIEE